MKIIVLSIFILNLNVILFRQNYADASQHQRVQAIQLGEGIKYPSHPLSETETRAKIFGKTLYAIYRISNPPLPEDFVTDAELIFLETPTGSNLTYAARNGGECEQDDWDLHSVVGEENRAVYDHDVPFRIGDSSGLTFSLFSDYPENYLFTFVCLNKDNNILRNGRHLYCDGPWEVGLYTREFPPNGVKWCEAEQDLGDALGISFDNEFDRFEITKYGLNDHCRDGQAN